MDSAEIRDYVKQSLFILMSKTDYDKISMEMLADKSGISRRTIYRYFKSKYDILLFCKREILDNYFKNLTSNKDEETDLLVEIFQFISVNSNFFQMVYKNNLISLAVDIIEELISKVLKSSSDYQADMKDDEYIDFYISYTAGGCSRILEKWINDKRVHSPQQVLDVYHKVINLIEPSIKIDL